MKVVSAAALPMELLTTVGIWGAGLGNVQRLQFDAVPVGERAYFGRGAVSGPVQCRRQVAAHGLDAGAGRDSEVGCEAVKRHEKLVVLGRRDIGQRLQEIAIEKEIHLANGTRQIAGRELEREVSGARLAARSGAGCSRSRCGPGEWGRERFPDQDTLVRIGHVLVIALGQGETAGLIKKRLG